MDHDVTHLETHTGKTLKVRVQATAPTDPSPQPGDMFVDNTASSEVLGIRNESGWVYVSLLK